MRFDNSSLFVNTGRKPLSAMQRRKKNNRNNIFFVICLTVIAVLCIFVGLIVHVWLNYNESSSAPEKPAVVDEVKKEKEVKKEVKEEKKKTEKKETKVKYKSSGKESNYSKEIQKAFDELDATYAYGYILSNDNSMYINNVDKIKSTAAVSAFLTEYICAKIYTGEFDYTTYVSGYTGEQLIHNLTVNGSYDAAQLLISHFTPAKLNAYMQANGYENTYFGAEGEDTYTTVEDIMALMSKLSEKSGIFPYSDLYSRMKRSSVTNKIRAQLPEGASAANISATTDGETFDAAVVYSPNGNYIFVSIANEYSDDGTAANTAFAKGAASVYNLINK